MSMVGNPTKVTAAGDTTVRTGYTEFSAVCTAGAAALTAKFFNNTTNATNEIVRIVVPANTTVSTPDGLWIRAQDALKVNLSTSVGFVSVIIH